MFLAHYVRVEYAGGGLERVHGGIYSELGNLSAEHRSGVKMREGGSRSRVGKVVSRHINRLHGGDGAVPGRGDAFLHSSHLGRKGRLITHCRRHTAKKGGHFASRLGETEDIVYEKQYVLRVAGVLAVAEGFRKG